MLVLWIILAILAMLLITAFLVIFAGHLKLTFSYSDNDGFSLKAYALFIKVFDTNKKYKKAKKRIKHKKSDKKSYKPQQSQKQKTKQHYPITEIIRIVKNILDSFFKNHARNLTVRAARLNISVGASDAATTAILYGVVSQGVAYILELLDNLNDLKPIKKSDINIYPDYTSEKTSADIKFIFSFPIRSAISLFLDSEILGLFASTQKE